MKLKNLWIIALIISSLLLFASFSAEAADKIITDGTGDVSSVTLDGNTEVITTSPDIDVTNLDIKQATYTQQGTQVTLTLTVAGTIENRGSILDLTSSYDLNLNTVEYRFSLITSEQFYDVGYSNKTSQLSIGGGDPINLTSSDFTAQGDTITIYLSLDSVEETYENLSVEATFIKANLSSDNPDLFDFVYLSDLAPNPQLEVYEAYAPNIGETDEIIQFNGSISPLTGQPPYNFHWDFGDDTTSNQQNPTHAYTKAGKYTYTFTVTDQAGDSASETGTITISSGGDSNGSNSDQMILFLAILIIIIVIGVIVIVWIIRR